MENLSSMDITDLKDLSRKFNAEMTAAYRAGDMAGYIAAYDRNETVCQAIYEYHRAVESAQRAADARIRARYDAARVSYL